MIGQNAQQLFNLIQALPQLASTTGLLTGGAIPDPGMVKLPLPAAWILPAKGVNKIPESFMDTVPAKPWLLATYVVMLYIAYTSQTDLITNQYPLLESVIAAVHGQTAQSGSRWFLMGFTLEAINAGDNQSSARLIYQIEFGTYQSLFS